MTTAQYTSILTSFSLMGARMPNKPNTDLVPTGAADRALEAAGQAANHAAAAGAFADYLSRKANNTIRRQAADLGRFAGFLNAVGDRTGEKLGLDMQTFAAAVRSFPDAEPDAGAWSGVTWGLSRASVTGWSHRVTP